MFPAIDNDDAGGEVTEILGIPGRSETMRGVGMTPVPSGTPGTRHQHVTWINLAG